MKIEISSLSDKPMYEQIKDGIKLAVLNGELSNNQLLPSVRQLASDLNVSAITTKRAYIDLEHDGLIYTIAGKGTFVRLDSLDQLIKHWEEKLMNEFAEIIKKLMEAGISEEKLIEAIKQVYSKTK